MNEFKFACPNCHQSIQATTEYGGMEITCPKCQAAITVPQTSVAGAPKQNKLAKAPSTVHHAPTTPAMAAQAVRAKKKFPVKMWLGILGGIGAAVAGVIFIPKGIEKYKEHKAEVVAKEEAAKLPPPPPPDLELDAIVQKVTERYKSFKSYSAQGVSVADIDMSEVVKTLKQPVHLATKFSVLLSRDGFYRFEWARGEGQHEFKGAVWDAGKGDLMLLGKSVTRLKDRENAYTTFSGYSQTFGPWLGELFFSDTNSLTIAAKNLAKTNNDTLNGEKCYVLTGHLSFQDMMVWVDKQTFIIPQIEIFLGSQVNEADLTGLSLAQKAQIMKASKMKGEIVETYSNIETNKSLNADAFQASFAPSASVPRQEQKPRPPRRKS